MQQALSAVRAHHRYENIAYLATREEADLLDAQPEGVPTLTTQQQQVLAAAGYTGVVSAYVSEDDEQSDEDIKMFVCITLAGTADVTENDVATDELACVLTELSVALLTVAGRELASPEESWEVAEVDDEPDPGSTQS